MGVALPMTAAPWRLDVVGNHAVPESQRGSNLPVVLGVWEPMQADAFRSSHESVLNSCTQFDGP